MLHLQRDRSRHQNSSSNDHIFECYTIHSALLLFQVHGVDANGQVVIRRRLWRSGVIAYFRSLEPCLVGIEACATAHHWARELMALGHTVKLMPPAYVKAYVKRNKNDAASSPLVAG